MAGAFDPLAFQNDTFQVEAADVAVNAGHAAGTGTAYNAEFRVSAANPTAGLAAGTGTAYNATIGLSAIAYAGHASGTGTAYNAWPSSTAPTAGHAAGTGVAFHPLTDHSTTNLVTLVGAEVVYVPDPETRLTLAGVEVMYQSAADMRVTLVGVEVMYLEAPRPNQFRAHIIG